MMGLNKKQKTEKRKNKKQNTSKQSTSKHNNTKITQYYAVLFDHFRFSKKNITNYINIKTAADGAGARPRSPTTAQGETHKEQNRDPPSSQKNENRDHGKG